MRRLAAIAGNLVKAWLVLLVPAALMAFAGWRLGEIGEAPDSAAVSTRA